MIAIPQCLDFPADISVRKICDFYMQMLKLKNENIYHHSQQVANYAASTAAKMGLSPTEVSNIKTAAQLHDLGLLGVSNLILQKRPYLSTREMSTYKRHCISGACMLEDIPELTHIADIVRSHHEKWNGTGYPKRLKGANIPIGARIVAVADYYDNCLNPCTQLWQQEHANAIVALQDKSGLDFDPVVVKAFIESVIVANQLENK